MIFRVVPARLIQGKHNCKMRVLGNCKCVVLEAYHLTAVKFAQIAFISCY